MKRYLPILEPEMLLPLEICFSDLEGIKEMACRFHKVRKESLQTAVVVENLKILDRPVVLVFYFSSFNLRLLEIIATVTKSGRVISESGGEEHLRKEIHDEMVRNLVEVCPEFENELSSTQNTKDNWAIIIWNPMDT